MNARDTINPLQSALDVFRDSELSASVVSKRTRDIRCAREKEIVDEMNFERRRQRLLLADAGEAIPEELQECNDIRPKPKLDERFNDENTSLPPPTFLNLQWVRPIRGTHADDLALVFYPVVKGKRWPPRARPWPEYVQILLVPRWNTDRGNTKSDNGSKRKRSSRPPQVTLKDGSEPYRFVGCNSISLDSEGSKKVALYYNLIFMTTAATNLRASQPRSMDELEPFVAAEFDVRAWKRRLAQSSLRPEERVRIVGGDLHGQVGVIVDIDQGVASVVIAEQCEKESEPQEVSVEIKDLERHFQVGDNVRCLATSHDTGTKFGTVIEVKEWTAEDYATMPWVPDREDPFCVRDRDSFVAEKVGCFEITVLQMPQGTTASD